MVRIMENFNRTFFEILFRFAHRSFLLDDVIVFLGTYLPALLVIAAIVLIFSQKGMRRRLFLFCELALAVILSRGIVTEVIRFFYTHPRPAEALGIDALIVDTSRSFPSGHAMFFFAMAMVLLYWNKKWGTWFFVFAAVNGIARIIAGVHWPLDVLGGAVLGVLCAMVVHRLLEKQRRELEG